MQFGSIINRDVFVRIKFTKSTSVLKVQPTVLPCLDSDAASIWSYSFPAAADVTHTFECQSKTCFEASIVNSAFTLTLNLQHDL